MHQFSASTWEHAVGDGGKSLSFGTWRKKTKLRRCQVNLFRNLTGNYDTETLLQKDINMENIMWSTEECAFIHSINLTGPQGFCNQCWEVEVNTEQLFIFYNFYLLSSESRNDWQNYQWYIHLLPAAMAFWVHPCWWTNGRAARKICWRVSYSSCSAVSWSKWLLLPSPSSDLKQGAHSNVEKKKSREIVQCSIFYLK